MGHIEVKKHRDRYEVNAFYKQGSKSYYRIILDKDARKLAQFLVDLFLEGFPVKKALEIFVKRMKKKDWLGF